MDSEKKSLSRRWQLAPETWIWLALSVLAVLYAVRSTNPFWHLNATLSFDDADAAAIGERLLDRRGLPYVDAVSHQGPLLYWLAALAQLLGGRMQWYGVRALTNLAFLISMAGIWIAAVGARRRFVGALAAFLFVFISICLEEIQSVLGLVGEAIATPWLVVAFACTTWALAREPRLGLRCFLLGVAGISAALSGLCKQTYLLAVAPLGVWAAMVALGTPGSWRERWGGFTALLLGWLAPLCVVVGIYAIAGELQTFYYWFFRYDADIYMAPFRETNVPLALYLWARAHCYLSFAGVVLLCSVASLHLAPLFRSAREFPPAYARHGFDLTLVWLAVFGAVAGLSALRMWPQHDLPSIPWFALLIGLGIERTIGYNPYEAQSEARPWRSMLLVSLLITGFSVWMFEQSLDWLNQQRQRHKGSFADARPEKACEQINQLVPPSAPIFIWGFDGDLYITCQRHAASRYVYSTLVAGIVPPDWQSHEEWVARDAVANLISDLDSVHPPLILDSPSRLRGVSMTQIEPLERYLKSNYCRTDSFASNDGRQLTPWLRLDLCPKSIATEPEPSAPATAGLPSSGNLAN